MRMLLIGCLTLYTITLAAQEKVVLTTPVPSTVTEYEVVELRILKIPEWRLVITVRDNRGNVVVDRHIGIVSAQNPEGADVLIKALNKANLTVSSLEKRILEHMVTEGKLPAGTVTGTPQ